MTIRLYEPKAETPWQHARPRRYEKLAQSTRYDAVVVGGGIFGLTAAYLLKQAGKRVCVVERDRLGTGDTGLTTAHLTYVTDQRLHTLAKHFGEEGAALAWHAGAHAIDLVESIVDECGIKCEFRRVPGFLHASLSQPDEASQSDRESLEEDAKLAQKFGFPAQYLPSVPHFHLPGVRFPDQGIFHPLRYLAGLAEAIEGDGCRVHEESEVSEVQDDPLRVMVGEYDLLTDCVVIATHVPLMGKTGFLNATLMQTKIFPYSSYAIGAKISRDRLPEASFWDTSDPYYYLRVERGQTHDYVIFGGNDHKTGQVADHEERFHTLQEKLMEILPEAKPDKKWSGQVIETNDGLPYIGESTARQFIGTGFSGNGMTFGTLAGQMACDVFLGRENPWQKLFAVDRKHLRGGTWSYLTENLDYPYYFVKDRLARVADKTTDIPRGEGRIVSIDGQRVACSRDDNGKLTKVSAVCTHLGCLVRWNNAERTWDCPCHGSRFDPSGAVIAGPAEKPLEEHCDSSTQSAAKAAASK